VIGALVIGTLLAVGALAFVLYPVFFGATPRAAYAPVVPRESEREAAVGALREIEFDKATGKLSDTDYAELKARYTEAAVLAMRREDARSASEAAGLPDETEDEIEAAVRAYRAAHGACPTCGPRPESDAEFCSTCGRYLRDRCTDCGAPVEALEARYCVKCGNHLGSAVALPG
jgi:hypothetical protein